MNGGDEALRVAGLRYRYPGAAGWVLEVDELTLVRGEQALLVGGSGAGKSTLLQIIAGLMDPEPPLGEGRVEVAGRHIHALHGAARDRFRGARIGMIFQTFNLLHGFTALENVMAAMFFSEGVPKGERRGRAEGLLKSLGIERVNAEVSRLSVGQQQRVAVARAVACSPALVLADEPTASLDPENAAAAMDLIQETCRGSGAALLCVSHDPGMVGRFKRVERLGGSRASGLGSAGSAGAGGGA